MPSADIRLLHQAGPREDAVRHRGVRLRRVRHIDRRRGNGGIGGCQLPRRKVRPRQKSRRQIPQAELDSFHNVEPTVNDRWRFGEREVVVRSRPVQRAQHGADGREFDVRVHARAPARFAVGGLDLNVGNRRRRLRRNSRRARCNWRFQNAARRFCQIHEPARPAGRCLRRPDQPACRRANNFARHFTTPFLLSVSKRLS